MKMVGRRKKVQLWGRRYLRRESTSLDVMVKLMRVADTIPFADKLDEPFAYLMDIVGIPILLG